jgi:hypothetical protein
MTREHPGRYRRAAVRPEQRLAFHDASRARQISFPTWRLYAEYCSMVRRHVDSRRERVRCYVDLIRWWPINWNWARMIVDLIAAVAPGVLIRAERLKQRMFSPEPGPSTESRPRSKRDPLA